MGSKEVELAMLLMLLLMNDDDDDDDDDGLGGRFGGFFFFFCSGRGKRESEALGRGGCRFLIANPRRGVSRRRRGRGAGSVFAANWGIGGGAAKCFFLGPKCPPSDDASSSDGANSGGDKHCDDDERPPTLAIASAAVAVTFTGTNTSSPSQFWIC